MFVTPPVFEDYEKVGQTCPPCSGSRDFIVTRITIPGDQAYGVVPIPLAF